MYVRQNLLNESKFLFDQQAIFSDAKDQIQITLKQLQGIDLTRLWVADLFVQGTYYYMKVRSHQVAKLVGRTKSPQPTLVNDIASPLLKPSHRPSLTRGIPRHTASQKVITVVNNRSPLRPEDRLGKIKESVNGARALIEAQKTRDGNRLRGDNGRKAGDDDGDTTEQTSRPAIHSAGQYQLESYQLLARRKNVKFEEKVIPIEQQPRHSSIERHSARGSSILKRGGKALERSLANDKSVSIRDNSFTAPVKCKLTLAAQNAANSAARSRYEEAVSLLKAKAKEGVVREKYIDENFPPVEASAVGSKGGRSKQDLVWMRVGQIFQGRSLRVFSKVKKESTSIINGGFTQSYVVSCFNAIKQQQDLLSHIFDSEQVSPYGIYLLRVYQDNAWRLVLIDDFIPCVKRRVKGKRQEQYMPAYVNVSGQSGATLYIWPLLLEKVYAKHYHCYNNLLRCDKTDLLADLMGSPPSFIAVGNKKQESAVDGGLKVLQEGGVLMGSHQEKSLWCSLSFVQNTYVADDKILAYRDSNSSSTDQVITVDQKHLPSVFTSVHAYSFNRFPHHTTCPVYPPKSTKLAPRPREKQAKHMEIPPNDTTSIRTFTLLKRTRCCLDLQQREARLARGEYVWVRCLLIQKEYDGGFRWISGRYGRQRHLVLQETLQAGDYYVVVMVEWGLEHNKAITLVVHSHSEFVRLDRRAYDRRERVVELACMDLAQRYGKFTQINRSICSYTLLSPECALIIENINNERVKGPVTVMRSINGLKSRTEILPINKEFETEVAQQGRKGRTVLGYNVELDIAKGESYTVVLRMRGGIDHKFFRMFHFS